MFKAALILNTLLLLSLSASVQSASETPEQMLQQADSYRIADANALVQTRITTYEDDQLDKQRDYSVYLKPGRRSLVIMRSASELGQKVLMLDENFWIILPKSRRPVRITPLQRILGDASVGDIATLAWSEDYSIEQSSQKSLEGQLLDYLELKATRKGLSYDRIELYLNPDSHEPVMADLFLASGKQAKRAWFKQGELDGRLQTVSMTLVDAIKTGKRTEVQYLSNQPAEIPDKYFNPAFLVRNDLEGL